MNRKDWYLRLETEIRRRLDTFEEPFLELKETRQTNGEGLLLRLATSTRGFDSWLHLTPGDEFDSFMEATAGVTPEFDDSPGAFAMILVDAALYELASWGWPTDDSGKLLAEWVPPDSDRSAAVTSRPPR